MLKEQGGAETLLGRSVGKGSLSSGNVELGELTKAVELGKLL